MSTTRAPPRNPDSHESCEILTEASGTETCLPTRHCLLLYKDQDNQSATPQPRQCDDSRDEARDRNGTGPNGPDRYGRGPFVSGRYPQFRMASISRPPKFKISIFNIEK